MTGSSRAHKGTEQVGPTRHRSSRTARQIASFVAASGRIPRWQALLPEGWARDQEELLVALGLDSTAGLRRRLRPHLVRVLDGWILSGQVPYFLLRKRWLADQMREAIHSGVAQIVILGAGYDVLGTRIAREFRDVSVWEVERPGMAEPKRRALAGSPHPPPPTHHVVEADLRCASWITSLHAAGRWHPARATAFVAEGLLMYLQPAVVARLVRQARSLGGPGSGLWLTYLKAGRAGRVDFGPFTWLVHAGLTCFREPILWSAGFDDVVSLFERCGIAPGLPRHRTDLRTWFPTLSRSVAPGGPRAEFVASGTW